MFASAPSVKQKTCHQTFGKIKAEQVHLHKQAKVKTNDISNKTKITNSDKIHEIEWDLGHTYQQIWYKAHNTYILADA